MTPHNLGRDSQFAQGFAQTKLLHPYFGDFVLDVIADIYIHEHQVWLKFVERTHDKHSTQEATVSIIAERIQACLNLMSIDAFANVWRNYKSHEEVYQFLVTEAELGIDEKRLTMLKKYQSEDDVEDLLFYFVDSGFVPTEMKVLAITYACLADMREIARESKSSKGISYEDWLRKCNLCQFTLDAEALGSEGNSDVFLSMEETFANHNGTFSDKKLLNDMMELAYLFHDQPKRIY